MTRRPHIGVATCSTVPSLDDDGPALLEALRSAGATTTVGVWDDPSVQWPNFNLVLVRSTWDYPRRLAQFLTWITQCQRTANPAPVLAWNTDKRYLQDLHHAGVPVVPTVFLDPGKPYRAPSHDSAQVVIKPTVSVGAADTGRFPHEDPRATDMIASLHTQGRPVMVQPYLSDIDTLGETAMIYLGGHFSHAVRKGPLLTSPGTRPPLIGDAARELITPARATPEQRTLADAALTAVPGGPEQLAYARVDLIPSRKGPVVLEVELTEPSLFLDHAHHPAIKRFAAHLTQAARGVIVKGSSADTLSR